MSDTLPPKFTGCRVGKKSPGRARKPGGVFDRLGSLKVGESTTVPLSWWKGVHTAAKNIGIAVATRSLGSKEEITVWRTG